MGGVQGGGGRWDLTSAHPSHAVSYYRTCPPPKPSALSHPLLSDSMCADLAQGFHFAPHCSTLHDCVLFRAPASPSTLTTLPMMGAV